MRESCHAFNKSWHTYEWALSNMWMRRVTHMNESWHPALACCNAWRHGTSGHVPYHHMARHDMQHIITSTWHVLRCAMSSHGTWCTISSHGHTPYHHIMAYRSLRRSDWKYLDLQICPISGQIFRVTGTQFTQVKSRLKLWAVPWKRVWCVFDACLMRMGTPVKTCWKCWLSWSFKVWSPPRVVVAYRDVTYGVATLSRVD